MLYHANSETYCNTYRLDEEGKNAVIAYMIKKGNAEWDDDAHTRVRLIQKSTETLAGEIYTWMQSKGLMGSVYTVYELHAGEEYRNTGRHGHNRLKVIYSED